MKLNKELFKTELYKKSFSQVKLANQVHSNPFEGLSLENVALCKGAVYMSLVVWFLFVLGLLFFCPVCFYRLCKHGFKIPTHHCRSERDAGFPIAAEPPCQQHHN